MDENRVGILAQGKAPTRHYLAGPQRFQESGNGLGQKNLPHSKAQDQTTGQNQPRGGGHHGRQGPPASPGKQRHRDQNGQVRLIGQEAQENPAGQRRVVQQQQAATQEHRWIESRFDA